MAGRSHPALASVTIRRLVLPEAEAGHGLDDAIAAALAREFGAGGADASPRPGVAQAIARGIAGHPAMAGRSGDGGR
jgi:hypothetical protein